MNFTKKQMALAVGLALSAAATPAMADKYWVCGEGNWSSSSCWSNTYGGAGGAGVPGSGVSAFGSKYYNWVYSHPNYDWNHNVIGSSNYYESRIHYNATSQPIANLTLNGASYHYQNGSDYYTAILDISNNATFGVTGNLIVGSNSQVYQNSGQSNVGNTLALGSGGSSAKYYLNGGSLNAYSQEIGSTGGGGFVQSAGTTNTAGGSLVIGLAAGSNGYYDMVGGSLTTTFDQVVGSSGRGFFYQSGGTNTVGTNFWLAANTGSYASYSQTAGVHSVGNLAYIATQTGSTGIYNLQGGSFSSNLMVLGRHIGANGTLNQSGGSNLADRLVVGLEGTGTYSQSAGTNTVTGSLYSDSGTLIVGDSAGSSGTYNLSGTGSLSAKNVNVGLYGNSNGTFNQTGGTHTVSNNLTLGNGSGSRGIYNLNGGTLTVGNIVRGVGTSAFNFNAGTLNMTGAGGLNVGTGPLGNNQTLGVGKALNVTNNLTINAGSNVNVSGGALGAGSAINHGTLSSNSSLGVGAGLTNAGTLNLSGGTVAGNINNAGTVAISNTVNHTGTLTQTAGATTVNGTLNTSGIDIQGGLLKGSGNIVGSVLNSAGTVAVGNSPGSMTINGDYTQSLAGIFDVELGGLIAGSQYDTLNVTGTANLDGTLNVSLFDLGSGLFNPHQGDTFDILSAEHLNGNFGSLLLAPLDAGLKWNIAYLIDANGTTDVVRLSVQSVPVPAAVWLLGSGLLGLAGIARRKI